MYLKLTRFHIQTCSLSKGYLPVITIHTLKNTSTKTCTICRNLLMYSASNNILPDNTDLISSLLKRVTLCCQYTLSWINFLECIIICLYISILFAHLDLWLTWFQLQKLTSLLPHQHSHNVNSPNKNVMFEITHKLYNNNSNTPCDLLWQLSRQLLHLLVC